MNIKKFTFKLFCCLMFMTITTFQALAEGVTNYLTMTANANSKITPHYVYETLSKKPNIEYSIDNGETWTAFNSAVNLEKGQSVKFRGNNPNGLSYAPTAWAADETFNTLTTTNDYFQFYISGNVKLSGSIMSLIDNKGISTKIPNDYCFNRLFWNDSGIPSGLTEIEDGVLPATELTFCCYKAMFHTCENLTTVPRNLLPATELAAGCYNNMFLNCKKLTSAPNLPAKKLIYHCYAGMFSNCQSLSFIEVDFESWESIKPIPTGVKYLPSEPTSNWLDGVTYTGVFVCPEELITKNGGSYVPEGWAIEYSTPKLIDEQYCTENNISTEFVGYYAIADADDLYWFAAQINKGNTFINGLLINDIVVNDNVLKDGALNETEKDNFKVWTPIENFKGVFDGNEHMISGLYINNETQDYVALFAKINNGAFVKKVAVIESYFKGKSFVGGICGFNYGNIDRCYNTSVIEGVADNVAGISGYSYGKISHCYNKGVVTGSNYVAGICGVNYGGSASIQNCYNAGNIVGAHNIVGGICGEVFSGSIKNCYNTANVSSINDEDIAGGVCGFFYTGTIVNCYNIGVLSGKERTNSVCDWVEAGATIVNCFYLADIADENGARTSEQFADGTVVNELRNYDNDKEETAKIGSEIWGQVINKDEFPNFNGEITIKTPILIDEQYCTENNISTEFVGYYAIKNIKEFNIYIKSLNKETANQKAIILTDIDLNDNINIPENATIVIPEGVSLKTVNPAVLTNEGTLIVDGEISGNDIAGNGTFKYSKITEENVKLISSEIQYNGTDNTIGNGISVNYDVKTICGKEFTFDNSNYTITYNNNENVSTEDNKASIVWTSSNGVVTKEFVITKALLKITADNFTITQGDQIPNFTVKYEGFVNNETDEILTVKPTITCEASTTSVAGDYTITVNGAEATNYEISYVQGTLTINENTESAIAKYAKEAVKIYTNQNMIVVENAESEIEVINMLGQSVKRQNNDNERVEIPMSNDGIYIIKTSGVAQKIFVK